MYAVDQIQVKRSDDQLLSHRQRALQQAHTPTSFLSLPMSNRGSMFQGRKGAFGTPRGVIGTFARFASHAPQSSDHLDQDTVCFGGCPRLRTTRRDRRAVYDGLIHGVTAHDIPLAYHVTGVRRRFSSPRAGRRPSLTPARHPYRSACTPSLAPEWAPRTTGMGARSAELGWWLARQSTERSCPAPRTLGI